MPTEKRTDAAAASRRKPWHQTVPVNGLLFLAMFFSTWGSGLRMTSGALAIASITARFTSFGGVV